MPDNLIPTNPLPLSVVAQSANDAARSAAFAEFKARQSANTIRRQRADLELFEKFLREYGVPVESLDASPFAWSGITWGLVKAFQAWQLAQGYAIASINGHLSTIRAYARVAAEAGAITPEEAVLIAGVKGYKRKDARNVDEKRHEAGAPTRRSTKKAQSVTIPDDVAELLKHEHQNTPQGWRDALLMCLLLDHGLRVGEVASLTLDDFDLKAHTLTIYRRKVDLTQTFRLTPDTREAAKVYLRRYAPKDGVIWRRSNKGTGKLGQPLSPLSAERALNKRVELLGREAGLERLSPHDCRHYWATFEARNNTPVDRLMDAGGWSNPTMAMRYVNRARIANEGTARLKESL